MLPLPTRKKGELLIRVRAASVNPKDWKMRQEMRWDLGCKSCFGEDISGDVVDCDSDSKFRRGDRIFAMLNMLQWRGDARFFRGDSSYLPKVSMREPEHTPQDGAIRWGASSEYTVVEERWCALLPSSISYNDAASTPLAALTAYQTLRKAGLSGPGSLKGRHVLVHAGAGGVGTWGIQLAKWAGAFVSTTCSPRNNDFVKSIGCDFPIDYHTVRFESAFPDGKGPDTILDLMGGDYEMRSLNLLPKGGHYLHVLNSGWKTYFEDSYFKPIFPLVWFGHTLLRYSASAIGLSSINYHFGVVCPSGDDLCLIASLMEEQKCSPIIDSVVKLSAKDMARAHDKSMGGHCRGKIVVACGEPNSKL
eukprot:g3080.t1